MTPPVSVSELERVNGDAVRLARLAALAARIEPELLRALRLDLMAGVDVSAEGDLWFSDIVSIRGASSILFDADALSFLRDWTNADRELLGQAAATIHRVHEGADPLVLLEERVIAAALGGDAKVIDDELLSITGAILDQPRRAQDLSAWAVRVLPRLPAVTRHGSAYWTLKFAAESRVASAGPVVEQVPAPAIFDGVFPAAMAGDSVGVEVERYGDILRLRVGSATDDLPVRVPPTRPIVLRVSSALAPDVVRVLPGTWTNVKVQGDSVELRAVDGRRYQIASAGHVAGEAATEEKEASTSFDPRAVVEVEVDRRQFNGYLVAPDLVVTASDDELQPSEPPFPVTVRLGALRYDGFVVEADDSDRSHDSACERRAAWCARALRSS
jgi:hypothetical protein